MKSVEKWHFYGTLGFLLGGMLALTACASSKAPRRPPLFGRGGAIEEVHLFGSPMALDTDSTPGPDAVGLHIYASSSKYAHGLRIRSGTLEIVMFDGVASAIANDSASKPRHVWTLTPETLAKNETETSLGIGYRLALPWGADRPEKKNVTIIARYIPPGGAPMYLLPEHYLPASEVARSGKFSLRCFKFDLARVAFSLAPI